MSREVGQMLTPVVVLSDPPAAGSALAVVGYATAPAGRPVLAGPAVPVYVVSDAEVAAGYPVLGNTPVPMVLAAGAGVSVPAGQPTIPVRVVAGSLSPTPAFPAGMVARWTLDDAVAGYTDLVAGAALSPGGSGVGTAAGVIGDALSLGGAGWLTTPDAPANALDHGMAAEAWIYPTAAVGSGFILAKDVAGGREWYLFRTSASELNFALFNSGGTFHQIAAAVSTPINTWHHVVGVAAFGGGASRLYLNGVLVGSTVVAGTPAVTATALRVGAREFSGAESPFVGRIDEVAIWQFGAGGDPGAAFWLDRYNAGTGRRP